MILNIPLVHRLRDAQGAFVPLGELGDNLVSVRADLDEIEAFGFTIERHPYQGVAYRGPAGRLCPDQIEHGLDSLRIGRRVAVWNRVSSTNDLATRAAQSLANEGLVVLAEEQTAGRGRRGKSWTAPPRSSILMSVLLFPSARLADISWLTALGAVATAEVVAEWTGLDAKIKWPNDVRVGGRKIAGILVERGSAAVVGIGLNVNVGPDDFPPELRASATSLRLLNGALVDRSDVARALIVRLDHWYGRGLVGGPETLNRPWRERSEHLGQLVRMTTTSGRLSGRLVDLDLLRGLMIAGPDDVPRQIPNHEILALSPDDPERPFEA